MEYKVIIPDEVYSVMEWEDDGLPAVCVVNQSLVDFEQKIVFSWWLSIIVDSHDSIGNGMPTNAEVQILDQIGDDFNEGLKRDGNALFYARITSNDTRQFIYRVHDPEKANSYLMEIIDNEENIRSFDFKMEHDEKWENQNFILNTIKGKK